MNVVIGRKNQKQNNLLRGKYQKKGMVVLNNMGVKIFNMKRIDVV